MLSQLSRFISALMVVLVLFAGCKAVTGKTLGRHIDDAGITATVKGKLASDDATSLARIGVKTHQGIVNLTGTVKNSEIKERAGKIARGVDGVQSVVNNLQVEQ